MIMKIMKTTLLLTLLTSLNVNADTLKVFVKKNSLLETLSANELRRIYLGKVVKLPAGVQLTPLDQNENSDDFSAFYNMIVKKTQSQVNAHWSRQIFSGKGRPPKQVTDLSTLIAKVQEGGNFVGYTTKELPAVELKILFQLDI